MKIDLCALGAEAVRIAAETGASLAIVELEPGTYVEREPCIYEIEDDPS